MTREASLFSSSAHAFAFWAGSVAVAIGVVLHVPMFWMGRNNGFHLAGMPMGNGMLFGMFLIVAGFVATGWGLMPGRRRRSDVWEDITPPEDAPLTSAHWLQIFLIAVALVIDIMKAATLGFVTPGMRVEYGITFAKAALVPLSGLTGTT